MNVRPGIFLPAMRRMVMAGVASLGALGAGASYAAPPALPANASPVTTSAIAGAEQTAVWPTFAGIPETPKDVRSVAAWKRAVVEIEANGRQLTQMAAAEPWTLSDTVAWATRQRAEATPPPPITTADDPDTDAAVAALRERAKEPPRSH
jgi:hypothetical protein